MVIDIFPLKTVVVFIAKEVLLLKASGIVIVIIFILINFLFQQIVRQVVSKKFDDWEVYDEKYKNNEDLSVPEKSSIEVSI